MPVLGGDRKSLWIVMGIFLILSLLIVTATEIAALPAVVIFPAMYCFYADRVQLRWPMLIACAPLVLALVPAFSLGATVYAVILVSAGMMHFFLKRGSIGLSVAAPSLLIFIIIAASILSFSQSNGLQVGEVLNRWAADVTIQMGKVSQNALSSSELSEFREKIPVFQERIVELFPSIILTSVAVIMWLNLLIIKWRYRAMAVREWKCPDWVIAFFILAAVLTIVPQKYLQTIGLNLLIIVGQVYLFQGLAIVSVFMDERKWPSVLRWPIYILILIQIYIIVIVAGFGLFDTWFDFRKRIRTPKGDIQ